MDTSQRQPIVGLVGAPNSGKTTLFNRLTHSSAKTVNYPGSTVDVQVATLHGPQSQNLKIFDTPGVYGLAGDGAEEVLTLEIVSRKSSETPDFLLLCLDATQLARQLTFALQLQMLGWRLVVAVTMTDLARKSGQEVDTEKLAKLLSVPVIPINGQNGQGIEKLIGQLLETSTQPAPAVPPKATWDLSPQVLHSSAKHAAQMATKLVKIDNKTPQQQTLSLDNWLLHPILGLVFFVLIMGGLFSAVFWLSQPLMDLVDASFGISAGLIKENLPPGTLNDFLSEGVMASFGSVLVFVPQILILFAGICLLEDSGYLARVATLVDKPFSYLGLSGRSFVSLLAGYACAVPAILAARSIRSRKERWLTIFIVPLLSCSARLPVYALLLTFLFVGEPSWKPGLALTAIYLGSLVFAALFAALLDRFKEGDPAHSFALELPLYRRPLLSVVLKTAWQRTFMYIKRAGPVIFILALIIWVGTTFPKAPEGTPSSQAIQQSYLGKLGSTIEPIFEPMGLDWRAGVAILSAFAAREVFVSALALTYDVASEDDETIREGLLSQMQAAVHSDGSPIFTAATVFGLIIFFMIALQCTTTSAVVFREMHSWKVTIVQLVAFNGVAYILAVIAVKVGTFLGA